MEIIVLKKGNIVSMGKGQDRAEVVLVREGGDWKKTSVTKHLRRVGATEQWVDVEGQKYNFSQK